MCSGRTARPYRSWEGVKLSQERLCTHWARQGRSVQTFSISASCILDGDYSLEIAADGVSQYSHMISPILLMIRAGPAVNRCPKVEDVLESLQALLGLNVATNVYTTLLLCSGLRIKLLAVYSRFSGGRFPVVQRHNPVCWDDKWPTCYIGETGAPCTFFFLQIQPVPTICRISSNCSLLLVDISFQNKKSRRG